MEFPFGLPLLMDGSADSLPLYGMPTSVPLENWIPEHPGALEKLFAGYLDAGALTLCAPTACANRVCLNGTPWETRVAELSTRLVSITRRTAEKAGVPVGGIVGPSGWFVPPFGEADFDDIYEMYREQIRALQKAGVDFLLMDRQTSLADMRAALLAARTTNLPVLLSLLVDAGGHTMTGCSLLPALITLQAMGADAVGINPSAVTEDVTDSVSRAAAHAAVPLLARPDADEMSPRQFSDAVRALLEAGARIIGGGSETTPAHLKAAGTEIKNYGPPEIPEEPDCYAASIEREAFFLGEDIIYSDPISCTPSLEDDLIDLDDEQVSAALVSMNSVDDAILLGRKSSMTRLPIAVQADSPIVLDAALRYFQGRLIVDSNCALKRETIEPLAKKYGAIIY